ncbi:MAG: hypothetical protein ABSH17_03710 [Syntrophobacteraceae bacterium]
MLQFLRRRTCRAAAGYEDRTQVAFKKVSSDTWRSLVIYAALRRGLYRRRRFEWRIWLAALLPRLDGGRAVEFATDDARLLIGCLACNLLHLIQDGTVRFEQKTRIILNRYDTSSY